MFIRGDVRNSVRKPFIRPLRFSLSRGESYETEPGIETAVSVDISAQGIGILTDHPIDKGSVLKFENAIKLQEEILRKVAVVKWTGKLYGKCRIGLEFLEN